MIRIDAMVMELLHKSNRILNVFGHCSTSVFVPLMDGQPLPEMIVTKNALSPLSKLHIAIEMAKSIADLHGFKHGPIVHGDVQYLQWLLNKNNEVILIDFNRAEPMLWDDVNEEYCKYATGQGIGNVRSPEEYMNELLDEKIDVYSFGMILYTLLTSEEPYYVDGEEIDDVLGEIFLENKPIVPTEIRNHSHAEMIMAKVMDKCIEYDLEKRVDIFTAVAMLEEGLRHNYDTNEKLEIKWNATNDEKEHNEDNEEATDEYYDYEYDVPDENESLEIQEDASTHNELRRRKR